MTTAATERPTSPLGQYLVTKRLNAKLTQDDVAERTGFGQPAISAWEQGRRLPTAKAVAALARALPGAKVDEILALLEQQDATS